MNIVLKIKDYNGNGSRITGLKSMINISNNTIKINQNQLE